MFNKIFYIYKGARLCFQYPILLGMVVYFCTKNLGEATNININHVSDATGQRESLVAAVVRFWKEEEDGERQGVVRALALPVSYGTFTATTVSKIISTCSAKISLDSSCIIE